METIDVNIFNGRIHMMVCTVRGREKGVSTIKEAIKRGDKFDVSGTNIKVSYQETASSFLRKFNYHLD